LRILKAYTSIPNFLSRFTILKLGKLHIRLHRILGKDETTLIHNHPFNYCSIILTGGYEETVLENGESVLKAHRAPKLIFRSHNTLHRIESVRRKTKTLFIAYGHYGWKAKNTQVGKFEDGLFQTELNGKILWSKREDDIWFIGNACKKNAQEESRHSIFQARQSHTDRPWSLFISSEGERGTT
jgi:hypothetical protein